MADNAFGKRTFEQSRGSNQAEQTGDQKFTDETDRKHCMKENRTELTNRTEARVTVKVMKHFRSEDSA